METDWFPFIGIGYQPVTKLMLAKHEVNKVSTQIILQLAVSINEVDKLIKGADADWLFCQPFFSCDSCV